MRDMNAQVQQLFLNQMTEVITEMKGQLTGMMLDIVKELVSPIVKNQTITLGVKFYINSVIW